MMIKNKNLIHTQSYLNSIFNHLLQKQQQSNQLQSDSSSDSSYSTTNTTTVSSSSSPISDTIPTQSHPISHIIDLLDQPNEDEKPEMLKSYLLNHHSKLLDVLNSELDSIVLSILHLHRQDTINSNSINKNTITSKLKPHSNLIRSNSTNNNSNHHSHYNSRRTCPSPRPLNRTQSYHLQTVSFSSSPTQFNCTINTPEKLSATASEFKPNKSVSSHSSINNLSSNIHSNPTLNANPTLWSFSPSPIGTPKFLPAPTSYLHALEDSLNVQTSNPTISQSDTTAPAQTSYFNQLHIPSDPWNSTVDQPIDFLSRDPWNTSDQHIPRDPWNTTDQHIPRDPWNTTDQQYLDHISRDPWINSIDPQQQQQQQLDQLKRDSWDYLVSSSHEDYQQEINFNQYDSFINSSSDSVSPPCSKKNSLRSNKSKSHQEEINFKSINKLVTNSNLKNQKSKVKETKFKIPLISIENVKEANPTKFKSSIINLSKNPILSSKSLINKPINANSDLDLDLNGFTSSNSIKVCRFYLQGSCLRSDCKFSHDLSKAICRFWLRGHCLKGESKCDFLHEIPDLMKSNSSTIEIDIKTKPIKKKNKMNEVVAEEEKVKERNLNEKFEEAFPSLMESMNTSKSIKSMTSNVLKPSGLIPKEYFNQVYDEQDLMIRTVSKERRDECIERYKVCLELNDELGIKSWLEEIQSWNTKIEIETKENKEKIINSRNRKLKDLIIKRESQNPIDRMKKGKEIGTGICLGVNHQIIGNSNPLNSKQSMEVLIDLNRFDLFDLKELIEKFIELIRIEGFIGLGYVLISELIEEDFKGLENWLDEGKYKWKIFDRKMICIDPVISQ